MHILIVEDEPRAVNQLQTMLRKCGFSYEVLAIIDTVEDAVVWFQTNPSPDLIFMDIQLADGLSLEIFQKTNVETPVIFTTAYDRYAIQAFKVNSIDYLLKPIQQDELQQALGKFDKTNRSTLVKPDLLKQLLTSMQTPDKREGILVKKGNSFVQINVSDLLYIYSEDSITFGVTLNQRHIIDETLTQLLESLDQRQFFQINRGQIISKKSIQKLVPYFNHRVKVSIVNPQNQEFIVSRQKTSDFKAWMNR